MIGERDRPGRVRNVSLRTGPCAFGATPNAARETRALPTIKSAHQLQILRECLRTATTSSFQRDTFL